MLYKPKFCCECGERIFRKEWRIWTSRRFCESCEIDKKSDELFWRFIAIVLFLFGLFGAGSLLLNKKDTEKPKSFVLVSENNNKPQAISQEKRIGDLNAKQANYLSENSTKVFNSTDGLEKAERKSIEAGEETEKIYFCGAMTQKGTYCRRRVKGGGRCWQHIGQPAILPKENLLINP
ncbi:MAG: hypothetical protein D6735_12320 [Acidobacteria bacterium]|nr:MAG: hypothetical protein D6735_12320 [Acidobacteriota bacterium]